MSTFKPFGFNVPNHHVTFTESWSNETEAPKLLDIPLVLEILATTTPMTSLTPMARITQSGSSRVRRTTTTRNRTR